MVGLHCAVFVGQSINGYASCPIQDSQPPAYALCTPPLAIAVFVLNGSMLTSSYDHRVYTINRQRLAAGFLVVSPDCTSYLQLNSLVHHILLSLACRRSLSVVLLQLAMPLSPEDIVREYVDDGSSLQRVSERKHELKIAIVEPNPAWAQSFLDVKARVEGAIGSTATAVYHTGSTSVPGLPAKDVIDVDLVVKDIEDEKAYVDALEHAGFRFLFREPAWHQHRFFVDERDVSPVNLHVFGPDCPEVARHRIFREWLLKTPSDLNEYAAVKRECAAAAAAADESMQQYTVRKDKIIHEILDRAFRSLGYVK